METFREAIKTSTAGTTRSYQGGFFKVLISPEQTAGNMSLVDMTLPKGVEPPTHVHSREDETFYLLEGVITFFIAEKEVRATAGDAVFAPRNVPHRFVIETESARFLTLFTPGQFLEYFMEFSTPAVGQPTITPPQGPPPPELMERIVSAMTGKYGIFPA